jgi:hypothetical protein
MCELEKYDEIVLPEVDTDESYDSPNMVIVPLDKYDFLVREADRMEVLFNYLVTSKKPSMDVIKSVVRVPCVK